MDFLEASNRIIGGNKKAKKSPYALPDVGAVNPLLGTPGYGQPAPELAAPAAEEAPAKPKRGPIREFFHDVGQTARAVGTGLYSSAADVLPQTVAKALTGSEINLDDQTFRQRYIAKQEEDLKRWQMSPEDRENKLFGIVKAGTVQQGLQNLGYSAGPMVAGALTGAAAASMVDSPLSPVADIVGGVVGAGALTAPMAYRSSKADYVLSMRRAFKQARPNGTEEEWQAFKKEIEDNARLYGLWEAGPEVLGNMVAAGLLKTGAGSIIKAIPLIENNAARLMASGVAKLALDMPVEIATESLTQYKQAAIEYESGLRAEPPTPAGAFVEAAPQTVVLTLATMGLGSIANTIVTDNSGQVQRHKIIRLLNKSGVGRDTVNDLLDAKNWKQFESALKKHDGEIKRVGADIEASLAGTPLAPETPAGGDAPATEPTAPINPLMQTEPAQPGQAFDVPMAAPVNPVVDVPKPTQNAEDAKLVADAMAARGERYAGIHAVDPVPSRAVDAVKEVSDKFGIRTIWISGPTVDGMAVQGAVVGDAPVLLLNADLLTNHRRDPVMMVYAHELTHRSERVDAGQYAVLEQAVLARADAQEGVARRIAAGMSEKEARSEAVAEAVEVLGTDQAFWQEVFQGKDQSFIDHIIQIITEMVERVFGANEAAKADAIRGAAVAAFQSLAQQRAQATTDTTGTNLTAPAGPAAKEAASAPVISSETKGVTPEQVESMRRRADVEAREKAQAQAEKAEREAKMAKIRKQPKQTRAKAAAERRMWDYDRGDTPLLNLVIDEFGGISPNSRKEMGGDNWGVAADTVPASVRSRLFPSKGKGSDWNDILWAAVDRGLLPEGSLPSDLSAKLEGEVRGMRRRYADEKAQAQAYKQAEADAKRFEEAVIQPDPNAAVKVAARDLTVGDKLVRDIDGIPVTFTVVDVVDDGGAVLKSQPYGEQLAEAIDDVYADDYIPADQDALKGEDVPFSEKAERRTPFGTPEPDSPAASADSDVLFSAKRVTSEDGDGRMREHNWNRFAKEMLNKERRLSYRQKSVKSAFDDLYKLYDQKGFLWTLRSLSDYSKEALDAFPIPMRLIAARKISDTAEQIFRSHHIADDGSNMPADPAIEELWHAYNAVVPTIPKTERDYGRAIANLKGTYNNHRMSHPYAVRQMLNEIHEDMATRQLGGNKPVVDSITAEMKKAYDEALATIEKEREAESKRADTAEERVKQLHKSLKVNIKTSATRLWKKMDASEDVKRTADAKMAEVFSRIAARGGDVASLSAKPQMEAALDLLRAHVYLHRDTETASVQAFLKKNGITVDDVTADAMIKDALVFIDGIVAEAAQTARASKKAKVGKKKPKAAPLNRTPDLTIQGPTDGKQQLIDQEKLLGSPANIFGEADGKRISLELTEAGQEVMRGISSNLDVVISNALRHGRNRAGIEAKLIEAGVDRSTARSIADRVTKRRRELLMPAMQTLRARYAGQGGKAARRVVSAMDRIMSAMDLADRASESSVSGFFDGNAWDEARNIIEAAFGFKNEINRKWFIETMKLYRKYEAADEVGNHIAATQIHRDLLNRVAKVQHGSGWWAAARSYVQGGLLFGPATHAWNLVNTASRNLDIAFVESERMVLRGIRDMNWDMIKAAFAPWYILGKSHKQAAGVAKYIMKTGINPLAMRIGEEAKFGGDPKVASAPEWHPFFQRAWMRPFKYVGRALIAADSYFRMNIENTDIYLRAYRDALKEGKDGAEAAKEALGYIGFVNDGTNEAYNQAAKRADELGLKGVDREMNIRIDLMNAVDPSMRDHASEQGAVETFNDPHPEGLAGMMADALRHNSSNPVTFWLGMFARIGANVFNYGIHTSPFGLLAATWARKVGTYKKGQALYKISAEEYSKRVLRGVHGLAIAGSVLAMCLKAQQDYDDDDDPKKVLRFGLTARGPRDINGQRLWRQQNKPFMLTINGKEISYKWAGPFATSLAMVGAYMDEKRYGNIANAEDEDGREESVASAILPTIMYGMLTITTDELPGQGMVEFADLVYSSGQSAEQTQRAWTRFIQKQSASIGTAAIPYSALVRYLDRIADPTVYTAQNIDGMKIYAYAFLRNMPYIRSRALYPMRNIFGEPIQVPDKGGDMDVGERAVKLAFDRFMNNMAKDEDIQFLMKAERGFRAPSRDETRIVTTADGLYGLRRMKDAEYDAFLEMFGKALRVEVARIRKSYSTPEMVEKFVNKKNDTLRKRLSNARSSAMNAAMREFMLKHGEAVRIKRK